MPYNMKQVNETHNAIKEFYTKQVTFHASMNTLTAGMADILPTLDAESKEKFVRLLKPFYAIQNNPFALIKSDADIIHGTYDTPEKKLEASALGIRLIENKLNAIPPIFFSSLLECMGVYPVVIKLMESLPKTQLANINSKFDPDNALSLFIKASQQATRYAMPLIPLEKFTDPKAEMILLNTKILPTLKKIAINAENHLDTLTLKNQAIVLLIKEKHAKLVKPSTSDRKKSIELIDKAIEDIQALPLADTYEERKQYIEELNRILSGTTFKGALKKSYQDLIDSMRDFILKKATVKQPAAALTTTAEAPAAQIQSVNVNLITEEDLKKIEKKLSSEWSYEKTHQGTPNITATFQKMVNNQVTNSFVIKSTNISTNDKDSETYRAMITAFMNAHPEKTLRMRAIDETELQKVKAICSEIQSGDATFKYTLTINEKINISPDINIAEPKQNAPITPDISAPEPQITNEAPQAPTTPWENAALPKERDLTNVNIDIPAAEPSPERAIYSISPVQTDIVNQKINQVPGVNSSADVTSIKDSIVASTDVNFVIAQINILNDAARQRTDLKQDISNFHIGAIEERVAELTTSSSKTPLKEALAALNGTLTGNEDDTQKRKESSKKEGFFTYIKNKITSGYRSLKNSYKKMSTAQKVGFWIGATVAVAAFAGVIVGLTVATGGAAPAIGVGAMVGVFASSKIIAGACAIVGVASAAFSVIQIKKVPLNDKKLGLGSTGLMDEVREDRKPAAKSTVIHTSNLDVKAVLTSNPPAATTSTASSQLDAPSPEAATSNSARNHPPTSSASSVPTVDNADDEEEGEKKHPTLGK